MSLSVSSSLYSMIGLNGPAVSRAPVVQYERRNADRTEFSPAAEENRNFKSSGTTLKSETNEEREDGSMRRTQIFEREDGRSFTRVEDFALTEGGSRRSVYQQNPSGSITEYEEVLDREPSGNFRRTQRFKDETGEVSTQITQNYKVTDSFILTGGNAASARTNSSPFQPARGTQLDLSA